jgi:hypothetical protein
VNATTVRIDSATALLCGITYADIQVDSRSVSSVGLPRYPWASEILVESLLEHSFTGNEVRGALNSFRSTRRGVARRLLEPAVDRLAQTNLITPVSAFDGEPYWLVTPPGIEITKQIVSAMPAYETVQLRDGALHAQAIIVAWLKRFRTVAARKSSAAT